MSTSVVPQIVSSEPLIPSLARAHAKKVSSSILAQKARQKAEIRFARIVHEHVLPYLESVASGELPDVSPDLRFRVSQELLNRYIGRPRETVDVNNTVTIRVDV